MRIFAKETSRAKAHALSSGDCPRADVKRRHPARLLSAFCGTIRGIIFDGQILYGRTAKKQSAFFAIPVASRADVW